MESFALEEFKSGRISKLELRKLLGFGDLERDRAALKEMGF